MYKLFNKILLVCLSVFVLLGVASTVSAQTETYNNTSLYITDVKLDKTSYSPGDEVNGTFIVHNINSFAVNDGNYTVSLAADYRNGGVPRNIISTSERIELPYLQSGTRETINFSYTLPLVAKGNDFGINVRAVLDSGVQLGWEDAKFDLTGNQLDLVNIRSTSIIVAGKAYLVTSGPTINTEDVGNLQINFQSPEELTLTPHISIKSQFNDDVVYDQNMKDISISPVGLDYYFELPNTFTPGVYLGTVELLDSDGINRISKLEFRYIIGGQIGTIQGIYTNQQSVESGEVVMIDINITGTPIDIVRVENDLAMDSARLDVVIKDSGNGKIVGSDSLSIDQLVNETYTFNIVADRSSKDITVEATLYGSDGSILDQNLTDIPKSELMNMGSLLINISMILGVIILLLLVGVVVKKRKAVETINQV